MKIKTSSSIFPPQIAGTVVKYELVLLDEVKNFGNFPDVCHYLSH
jgi:hypothetical protein